MGINSWNLMSNFLCKPANFQCLDNTMKFDSPRQQLKHHVSSTVDKAGFIRSTPKYLSPGMTASPGPQWVIRFAHHQTEKSQKDSDKLRGKANKKNQCFSQGLTRLQSNGQPHFFLAIALLTTSPALLLPPASETEETLHHWHAIQRRPHFPQSFLTIT